MPGSTLRCCHKCGSTRVTLYQRGYKLNAAELRMRERLAPSGRVVTTYRVGVATDWLPHNKYRSRCMGRGRCAGK